MAVAEPKKKKLFGEKIAAIFNPKNKLKDKRKTLADAQSQRIEEYKDVGGENKIYFVNQDVIEVT